MKVCTHCDPSGNEFYDPITGVGYPCSYCGGTKVLHPKKAQGKSPTPPPKLTRPHGRMPRAVRGRSRGPSPVYSFVYVILMACGHSPILLVAVLVAASYVVYVSWQWIVFAGLLWLAGVIFKNRVRRKRGYARKYVVR